MSMPVIVSSAFYVSVRQAISAPAARDRTPFFFLMIRRPPRSTLCRDDTRIHLMLSTRGYLRWSGFLLSLSLLILPALASCSVPWNTSSAVVPTPTPQFAGGEPVLPQLQKLYRDAPLPAGGITSSDQSWPLAGHDPANTSAAVAPALRGALRWFFQTPGPGLASPVAAAGLVLLNGGNRRFYAVDGTTGSLKWRAPRGDTLLAGTAAVTRAVSDGVIYVAAQGHGLMALS